MSGTTDLPSWSSDLPISLPTPPTSRVIIPMYGFGFTQYGITHDLTQAEYDYMTVPSYSPELPVGDSVYDDGNL